MTDIGHAVILQSRFTDTPHMTFLWFSLDDTSPDYSWVIQSVTDAMDRVASKFRRFDLVAGKREMFADETMVTRIVPTHPIMRAREILHGALLNEGGLYVPGVTPSRHTTFKPHISDWQGPSDYGITMPRSWGDGLRDPDPLDTLVLSRKIDSDAYESIWASPL